MTTCFRSMIRRMPEEITCLIVDDHEVVREGLRLSLSRAAHIRVVGEAADGEAAVALAERRRPNVVIMDVRMPGMDGLEATKELMDKVPDSSVLISVSLASTSCAVGFSPAWVRYWSTSRLSIMKPTSSGRTSSRLAGGTLSSFASMER